MNRFIPAAVTAAITIGVVSAAGPAAADTDVEVTSGRFHSTELGAERGYDVHGAATMMRSDADGGQTVVRSHATGLDRNTTYKSHVHNGPCAAGGGGHYQHDAGGDVDAVNEIWPTLATNGGGTGSGYATHDHRARVDAQSIVIHDPDDGGRIACLDLT